MISWCSTRSRSARTCPVCARASRPAMARFLTAPHRDPQHDRAHDARPRPPCVGRRVWIGETHVAAISQSYRAKFNVCDDVLGSRFGYARPPSSFFLWLDISHLGGAEDAALTIWQAGGVGVMPSTYSARAGSCGVSTRCGATFRVALVEDAATVRRALKRIVLVSA